MKYFGYFLKFFKSLFECESERERRLEQEKIWQEERDVYHAYKVEYIHIKNANKVRNQFNFVPHHNILTPSIKFKNNEIGCDRILGIRYVVVY